MSLIATFVIAYFGATVLFAFIESGWAWLVFLAIIGIPMLY